MPRLIIYCRGNPAFSAFKRRDFLWDDARKLYVWQNKVFTDMGEYHATVEKVLEKNQDLRPAVMVLSEDAPPPAAPPDELPPEPRAITLDEAVATVQRLAPDLLKKKSGPKAA